MNIILITDDFYPQLGGIAHTLMNLYKYMLERKEKLIIFNPFYKNKQIFKVLNERKFKFQDLPLLLVNKQFYFFLFLSTLRIFQAREIPISQRLKIILYLFIKPKILMDTIDNIIRLFPYLKKLDFDLLISSHSGALLVLVFILSKLFKKKFISLAHGNDFIIKDFLSLKSYYLRNTDIFIANCNTMKKLLKKVHNLDEKKIIVINRGISLEKSEVIQSKRDLRKEFQISEEEFIILSVGRQNLKKNFHMVIRAVKEIINRNPSIEIKYFLIGKGRETQNLKNLTKQLKLEKSIIFLDNIDNETRNKYYKLSDVFILPSVIRPKAIEGFGIVFLEANYYKIPVIGTKTGGVVDAIIDGETGFLIDSNDLDDLVNKILILYENEDLKLRMGENGYKRIIKEFLWEDIVEEYIKVFKNVIEN